MDKGGGCRPSNSRFDGFKPSSSTTPWSKDPVVVQALPAIRGPQPFDNGNPQELPGRKRRRSRNTNPLITFKKTQEEGSQVPRVRIKVNHSSTECAPRELVEKTLVEKKSYEENQGPISAAKELPPGQVLVSYTSLLLIHIQIVIWYSIINLVEHSLILLYGYFGSRKRGCQPNHRQDRR